MSTARPTSHITKAVRAAIDTDAHHGAVVPPLHLSSTFSFEGLGQKRVHDYTRTSNPTRDHLACALAELEGGARASVTSTGMSAVLLALQLVKPGDLVIAQHDCYGGTHRLLRSLAARGHFDVLFTDFALLDTALLAQRPPRMLWIETPSNPLLRITDIRSVAALGHAFGATVVVDNTFLSPALQQPITLGADIVVHSTTKYINGHSDVVGGCVIARDATVGDELAWWANCLGITGAPFDSYLTLRGIRTLHARMKIHTTSALTVAEYLAGHPSVSRVFYPGLASHPGHAVAASQQDGFGGMVSFEVVGGEDGVRAVAEGVTLFTLAESLGGVESLIAHPATMTHAAMPPEARAAAGISDTLLRLSVGIESCEDLVLDLEHALAGVPMTGLSARSRRGRTGLAPVLDIV